MAIPNNIESCDVGAVTPTSILTEIYRAFNRTSIMKLTINTEVYDLLHLAFPTLNTKRALDKYCKVLNEMLFHSSFWHDPTDPNYDPNHYSLSMKTLLQKGGRLGSKRIWLHSWLMDNAPLIKVVTKGSNLTQLVSQITLTDLTSLHDPLSEDTDMPYTNDPAIDNHISSGDEQAIFDYLYPELTEPHINFITKEDVKELFDPIKINVQSVKAYIEWLDSGVKVKHELKVKYRRHARILIAVANICDGIFFQRKSPSAFGRMYYTGLSMQSVNKLLRKAAIGNAYEYDIYCSAMSWKAGFADDAIKYYGLEGTKEDHIASLLVYLSHRTEFTEKLRNDVFLSNTKLSTEKQIQLLKQALTAISFGARSNKATRYYNRRGEEVYGSISEIIKVTAERHRFLDHELVKGFIASQELLDNYLFEMGKLADVTTLDCVKTPSGRISKSKVIAYLYQQSETEIMDLVKKIAIGRGHKLLASIHDCVIFRHRLGSELMEEILYSIREKTGNKLIKFTFTKLEPFVSLKAIKQQEAEAAEHAAWIKREEQKARELDPSWFANNEPQQTEEERLIAMLNEVASQSIY